MDTELHVNALVTEACVNYGDHGQDVTKAVIVTPDMTVRELCEKYLTKKDWHYAAPEFGFKSESQTVPDDSKYLTIRLAVEAADD